MGSLTVQPCLTSRNVTEVFIYLRNRSHHSRAFNNDAYNDFADEKFTLISLNEEKTVAASVEPPAWVNFIDEISFELGKIQTRSQHLKELQQKHLKRPDFSDEASVGEQEKIKDLTTEVTSIFTHVRQLIRLLQDADTVKRESLKALRENVVASFLLTLNNLLNDFRAAQSHYVRQIDARKKNIDSFLLSSGTTSNAFDIFDGIQANNSEEELTIDQLQMIVENESLVREREKEVIKISKSILELNTLFKDLAALVLDQGTILDRIDYNVEQSVIQIRSALTHVQKADKYRRERKMPVIIILAGIAAFLLLLLIATKL